LALSKKSHKGINLRLHNWKKLLEITRGGRISIETVRILDSNIRIEGEFDFIEMNEERKKILGMLSEGKGN
jgi:hypothetical protein